MQEADRAFTSHGFAKMARAIFVRDVVSDSDKRGWVGLNRSDFERDGTHFIHPMIGIRHDRIEQILAAVLPHGRRRRSDATAVTPLADLMPDSVHFWGFSPDSDTQATMRELVETVIEFGLPRMVELANEDELVALISGSIQSEVKLPAAYLALGKHHEARDAIQKELDKLGDDESPWTSYYRAFAANALGLALREA